MVAKREPACYTNEVKYTLIQNCYKRQGRTLSVKRVNHQEGIKIISIYEVNNRAPKYIKWLLTELMREIYSSTLIVGDFNASLSVIDGTSRQKIYIEIEDLNNTINQQT